MHECLTYLFSPPPPSFPLCHNGIISIGKRRQRIYHREREGEKNNRCLLSLTFVDDVRDGLKNFFRKSISSKFSIMESSG